MLDEPVASLDPLARREFLQGLMEFTAEHTVTVLLSSHLVADLERVCDYLILLADGRVQLSGEVDELLATHRRLSGPRRDRARPAREPAGHRGGAHRPPEHPARAHRGADHRPGLDGRGGQPRGHRARLHGPPGGSRRRAGEDRPMIWVAWRQFRTQALVTLGLLAAFAVLVLVTGLHLRDVYSSLGGTHCSGARTARRCRHRLDKPLSDLLGPALLAIPALLGMFWGAPLVARELESGTYRLAWTQSVTRRRWLSVRVALVGVAALAVAGLASWLVSWWFAPLDAVNMNRFDPSVFTARGIVAIGYAGFAFALGVTTGALMRRTLPAMATTLLGFIAARIAFTLWVRPHLLPRQAVLVPLTPGKGVGFLARPSGVSHRRGRADDPERLDDLGHARRSRPPRPQHRAAARPARPHLPDDRGGPATEPRRRRHQGGGPAGAAFQPANSLSHHLQQLVAYQPPSHYWPLQALETGIFLAAAFALIGATVWRVGRRAARRSGRRRVPSAGGRTDRSQGRAGGGGPAGAPSGRRRGELPAPPSRHEPEPPATDLTNLHPLERQEPNTMHCRHPSIPSIVATAIISLVVAACGGSGSPSSPSASNSGQPSQAQIRRAQQEAVRFAACMRSHGVANFPDPTTSPRAFKTALSTKSPAFASAETNCRHLLPNGGQPTHSDVHTHAQVVAMLAFARCIRSHGFRTFPDPTSAGQLTHEMVAGAGIDLHQPAVLQAATHAWALPTGFSPRPPWPASSQDIAGNRGACTGRRVRNERRTMTTFASDLSEADGCFVAYAAHELRGEITLQLTLAEVALADPEADTAALREMGGKSPPAASARNGCSRRC